MQTLVNMAVFVLAANLAYLRLETLEHRAQLRKYAREKMGKLDNVSNGLKKSDYYKRLSFWAGIVENDAKNKKVIADHLGWRKLSDYVFGVGQRDRKISNILAWSALVVVVGGTIAVTLQVQITGWITWIFLGLLELMILASFLLVWAGNDYISKSRILIDKDAEQWEIFMRDRTPDTKTISIKNMTGNS